MKKLFIIYFIFLSSVAWTQDVDITTNIINKYKNIDSIKVNFEQTLISKTTKQKEYKKGIIFCKKEGGNIFVRWENKYPEKEILIVRQNIIWDYFPQDKIAYKYTLSKIEQSKIIFDLMTGKIDLKEKFHVKIAEKNNNTIKLKLIPKNPSPNMVLVYLWVNESGLIKQIDIIDFFGNENIIKFSNISFNPIIGENIFFKTFPEGTKILEGRVRE